jgi:hypothetical protein
MKNNDLLRFLEGTKDIEVTDVKFNLVFLANKKLAQERVDEIREAAKPTKAFQDFEKERLEALKEMANKDEEGNPKMKGNQYDIEGNEKKWEKKYKELESKHKEAIDERNKQVEEANKVAEEECDIEFKKTKPVEGLTTKQIEALLLIDMLDEQLQ